MYADEQSFLRLLFVFHCLRLSKERFRVGRINAHHLRPWDKVTSHGVGVFAVGVILGLHFADSKTMCDVYKTIELAIITY